MASDGAETMSAGRSFQTCGATATKARSPIVRSRVRRTSSFWVVADRSRLLYLTFTFTLSYTSSLFPAMMPLTNSAAHQRLVLYTRHSSSQLSLLHLPLERFTAYAVKEARYWLRIAISAYPTCIRRPLPVGGVRRNIAMMNGLATRWWKQIWRYVYSFSHNPRRWRTHTQIETDTHRQTPHDGIGRAYA